jgi:structural maintenance of chromosome 4
MASVSPRKSTRAAATRRKAPIIDDDSDGEENHAPVEEQDEEDFTPEPAPKKTVRRGRPRKGADEDATPKTATRRRTRVKESVEPTQLFSPPGTSVEPGEPLSPRKSLSPRKRSTLKTSRKSRVSVAVSVQEEDDTQLPTPQPSASPEPTTLNAPGTPLADITDTAINERVSTPPTEDTMVEKVNAMDTVLEKPMDIVVRKRAAALPISQEPIEGKPRLIITYLVLTNFKSYAGRQEVGPFHTSFSAVVGPNGSGKSNVIDSLLFVFGFRASKMRQGKLSALIHNSAGHPDLDHCEVEVHFQEIIDLPTGGHEVVPDSTLIVSRKAFKNNASKYYINSRESTFTVVTNLLRNKGIDLDHKRFLILQGEVESIAQMKPKAANEHDDGLLEYLEDIIGTSKYKTPIEESATAVEELNEECMAKSNHVQIIEKEKNSLEDKKNKALAYIRDQNELAMKQATLYQMDISRLDDKIEVSQEKVTNMEKQLNEELQKHRGNEEEIKQLEKHYKKGAKEYERMEKQTQAILSEVARIDSATVKFDERKKFLTGRQKKFEKEKESSRTGMSSADTQVKQYGEDVERFVSEIEELENDLRVEEKEFEKIAKSIAPKTEGLSKQRDEKQASLAPWKEKVSEEQRAIAVSKQELDLLREKENSGAKGIADVEEKIAGLEESKEEKLAELEQCKTEKNSVEKQVSKKHAQIADLAKREPVLTTKLSGARQKADEARASLSATQTQGNVLKGLMRLKESGRINGFHGRLGNLGTIDQAYDVAISTACPQLENMVVDTVEVGQQCIDYLRKNNLGRANFILLNRLAQRDLSQIDTPENVPRLFDLVKPKHDKFRPAFFSVLQNTLVANDLEQANRIAYGAKRWRVVTLDGQLIDKSGTMTGGGTRVAKGGMSSKLAADVSPDQVVKLEHDRDSVEQEFVRFQEEQRDLEASLRELNDRIPQLETKAQKIALELESFDRNIADFQHRIEELSADQAKAKTNQGRISELEKKIVASEKKIAKLHGETAGIEEEIKALDDKIGEIGGVKLRTQRAKVTDLKQQIGSRTDAKSNAESQEIQAKNQHTKHEKAYNNATRELEKTATELEKAEEDMQTHKRDAAGKKHEAEEAQEVRLLILLIRNYTNSITGVGESKG